VSSAAPHIAVRYLSLFSWGRPPLPWGLADKINIALREHDIASVGVTGSLCPSVLTALAYGSPEREVNAFNYKSRWSDGTGWNCVLDDSPGMELDAPRAKPYLPVSSVHFWDGATPFFYSQALFVDLPFEHSHVRLKIDHLNGFDHRLLMLGFLDEHDGPVDVLDWAMSKGYEVSEHAEKITNVEKSMSLVYRLKIVRKPA
jgi:hypothetical protein